MTVPLVSISTHSAAGPSAPKKYSCQPLLTALGGRNTIQRMAGQLPTVGTVLGHYRILEEIGRGGMGVVFRARDEQLQRDVAVKILPGRIFPNESARKRFRREARVVARLNHPNVAMAFDYGEQDGIDYLVTEYVGGTRLDAKLANGALPEKTVIQLGIQLANGLAAAHHEQIVHRDLKPGNLRLTVDGQLKILDFGLAYWLDPDADLAKTLSLSEVSQDSAGGTLPFMAPEQIRCEPTDQRTDIWGAGAVLYVMATGQRPFPMTSRLKLIDAIEHLAPPAPSQLNKLVTPPLDAVILKALDKNPDRRYQSAGELSVDLNRLLPVTAESGKVPITEFANTKRRVPWLKWLSIAVLGSVCIYVGYQLREKWHAPGYGSHKLLTVLPFDSTVQDERTNVLIAGLTDTLTANLAQMQDPNLQVISARDIREQGVKTTKQASEEFGSNLVLEGSVHSVGDQVRVNCSLVDSKTRRQLNARTITADAKDVLGLEDQVTNEVVSLLATDLGTHSRPPVPVKAKSNSGAYASYLRGRGYLSEYQKPENIDLAIAELKNSVALDPHYPNSFAALGEAYLLGYQQTNRDSDWIKLAQQNCQKSLQVGETAEGHVCLGDNYNLTGNYDLAAQEFQRAVQLDPSNEDGLRGEADAYEKLGNPVAAEVTYKKAISLRPNYWGGYSWLGTFYYNQSRYADAISQFTKVIELAPLNYRGYSNLGAMYVVEGKYRDALAPLNKSIEIRPNLEAFNNLGNAYFQLRRFSDAADAFQHGLNLDDSDWLLWGNLGDSLFWGGGRPSAAIAAYEKAIAHAERKLKVNPKDSTVLAYSADYNAMSQHRQQAVEQIEKALSLAPEDGDVRLRAAIVYNQLGDTELCLASLEKAVAQGISVQVIRDTPDFDHLRNNPRFRRLVHLD
jgi:serine/threonine protein kinase/tetratricopeptide (TPR) repeat protein